MATVWLKLRVDVRVRWRALAGLALLLGLVGGVVLTAAAGARRTDTAYPRLLQWANAAQVDVLARRHRAHRVLRRAGPAAAGGSHLDRGLLPDRAPGAPRRAGAGGRLVQPRRCSRRLRQPGQDRAGPDVRPPGRRPGGDRPAAGRPGAPAARRHAAPARHPGRRRRRPRAGPGHPAGVPGRRHRRLRHRDRPHQHQLHRADAAAQPAVQRHTRGTDRSTTTETRPGSGCVRARA